MTTQIVRAIRDLEALHASHELASPALANAAWFVRAGLRAAVLPDGRCPLMLRALAHDVVALKKALRRA